MASAEQLGVEDVLEVLEGSFGMEGTAGKGEFRTLCPVHEMDEEGHEPSCDVNLETGYWNCFSCPASGDLVELGTKVLGRTRAEVRKLLKPDEPDAIRALVQRRLRTARRAHRRPVKSKKAFVPTVPPLEAYSAKESLFGYLYDRGFSKKTIRKWNLRYVKEATLEKEDGNYFTLTHAIGIPIFDKFGNLLAWCYRATPKSDSWFQNVRYIYTPGVTDTLAQIWFGMNHHQDEDQVAIVEGALDAIWCDQNGVPALAILGSQVKQLPKVRALMDFRKIILLCDRDLSGSTTAYHLGVALQERGVPCTVCRYPRWMLNRRGEPAKDPQDLSGLDLELVVSRAVPFIVWKRNNRAA